MKTIYNINDLEEAIDKNIFNLYFPTGLIFKFDNPILVNSKKTTANQSKYHFGYKKKRRLNGKSN